jgi:hypothetical protein
MFIHPLSINPLGGAGLLYFFFRRMSREIIKRSSKIVSEQRLVINIMPFVEKRAQACPRSIRKIGIKSEKPVLPLPGTKYIGTSCVI